MGPRVKRLVICAAAVLGAFSVAGAAVAAQRAVQIQISLPAHIRRHSVYDVTIQGFSPVPAVAYLFVDYSPCVRSFTVELRRARRESDAYPVRGRFDEISGWRSNSAGTDHACVYLVSRRSRLLLASTFDTFSIH
jgi:hypothetical protein